MGPRSKLFTPRDAPLVYALDHHKKLSEIYILVPDMYIDGGTVQSLETERPPSPWADTAIAIHLASTLECKDT